MSKVYIVISDSIIQGYESNCLHGVYATKDKAKSAAISAIISMAQGHYHNITKADICEMDDLEFNYQSNGLDIYVSCIEQEVM